MTRIHWTTTAASLAFAICTNINVNVVQMQMPGAPTLPQGAVFLPVGVMPPHN